MADEKTTKIKKRFSELEARRQLYEPLWEDIAEYLSPYRSLHADSDKEGNEPSKNVYDGLPIVYLNMLADGFLGYETSRSSVWLALRMADRNLEKIPGTLAWLQDSQDVLFSAFQRSNFYESMHEYFSDGGSIGTATIYIEEDVENAKIDFLTCHPWEVYIDENARGKVDTVFRKYELTYRQIGQHFKEDGNIPENILNRVKNQPNTKAWMLHAVYPRDIWVEGYASAKNKRYASEYYLFGPDILLRESGYDKLPYAVWRWRKNTNELYGRSPASDAIRDIQRVNKIGETQLRAAQMAADPPWAVPDYLEGRVRIRPRGINYIEEPYSAVPKALYTGGQYPIGDEAQERIDSILRQHFKVDIFMLLAQAERQMTATEILEKQGEKAAILGAVLGRLESEALNPIIDKVFDIEWNAGRIPPPPAALLEQSNQEIDVEFLGVLSQLQKRLFKTQGTQRFLEFAAQIATMNPQAVLMNIDWRELLELGAENLGAAVEILREKVEVDAEQQAMAQARAQNEQLAQLGAVADAVPKLSKSIEEGSPIEQIEQAAQGA